MLSSLLWGISVICWIVSIALIIFGVEFGIVLLGIAFVVSIAAFVLSKLSQEKFNLEPGENLVMTCRLTDSDNTSYYVRITNRRMVLSAVEYPLLPAFIGLLIDCFSKPSGITYSWNIEEISSIEEEEGTMGYRRILIMAKGEVFKFSTRNQNLLKWWEQVSQ